METNDTLYERNWLSPSIVGLYLSECWPETNLRASDVLPTPTSPSKHNLAYFSFRLDRVKLWIKNKTIYGDNDVLATLLLQYKKIKSS